MKGKYIIWDRDESRFGVFRGHHIDKENNREYFKIEGCSLWLEDGVALDVFVRVEKNALIPLRDFKKK